MRVEKTSLPGVVLITPAVHGDERGFFMETYHQRAFSEAGLPDQFVQDNHSRSAHGVLRGLHFQYPQWQGKLVRVIRGEIFDVAVDVRMDSPTFGQWYGVAINEENKQQIYVPPGYAHGFCVLSDSADVVYKCTALYKPRMRSVSAGTIRPLVSNGRSRIPSYRPGIRPPANWPTFIFAEAGCADC